MNDDPRPVEHVVRDALNSLRFVSATDYTGVQALVRAKRDLEAVMARFAKGREAQLTRNR